MATVIWHYPRCSKSRQTLKLLQDNGIEPIIREYLKDVPTAEELAEVLDALDMEPKKFMRRREKAYKELGLKSVDDRDTLLAAMVERPKLIQRPVVFHDDKIALGRPPEAVLDIL